MLDRITRWLSAGELVILLLTGPLFLFIRPSFAPILLLLPLLWLARYRSRGSFVPRTPVDWPILGLMSMALVSILVTPDLPFSFRKVAGLLYGIAIFYAVVEWGQQHRTILPTAILVSGLGCGAAFLALLGTEWVVKLPALDKIVTHLPAVIRGMPGAETGFNPNQVSGALIMFIPVQAFMLWDALSDKSVGKGRRALLVAGAGIALAITSSVVLVAQSRASWVALIIGLAGMCAIEYRRVRLPVVMLLIAGLAVAFVLWLSGGGDWLLQQVWAVSPGETSWAARTELWSRGLWIIAEHPLTGTGMNIFRRLAWHAFPLFQFEYGRDIGHAHQAYIQVALDLGLPGLICYVALVFGTLASGWVIYRGSEEGFVRHVALASATGVAIHAVWGFADAVALGAKQSFLWWSVLALVATVIIQNCRQGVSDESPRTLPALGEGDAHT